MLEYAGMFLNIVACSRTLLYNRCIKDVNYYHHYFFKLSVGVKHAFDISYVTVSLNANAYNIKPKSRLIYRLLEGQ